MLNSGADSCILVNERCEFNDCELGSMSCNITFRWLCTLSFGIVSVQLCNQRTDQLNTSFSCMTWLFKHLICKVCLDEMRLPGTSVEERN